MSFPFVTLPIWKKAGRGSNSLLGIVLTMVASLAVFERYAENDLFGERCSATTEIYSGGQ
eukprot:4168687-Ditylum_brightwellii.AAC.1